MISDNSHSESNCSKRPVFIVSHSKQEEVCKEVYDYLVYKKIQKLKEAVQQFNKVIRKLLK